MSALSSLRRAEDIYDGARAPSGTMSSPARLIPNGSDVVDRSVSGVAGDGSVVCRRPVRAGGAPGDLALVLREDDALHPLPRLGVERVGDVLEGPVLSALCGHRDEQPGISVDDLEVPDHEAAVERDRDVGLELFLADREDADLGDLHGVTLGCRRTVRTAVTCTFGSTPPPVVSIFRAAPRASSRSRNTPNTVGPLPDMIAALAPCPTSDPSRSRSAGLRAPQGG